MFGNIPGEDEGDIDGGEGVGAEAGLGVDGALQCADAEEGGELEEEAEADDDDVLPDEELFAVDVSDGQGGGVVRHFLGHD